MHVYIYLNHVMNEMTRLPLQTHVIYPVVVEYLDFHYQPSLYLYWLLPMELVVEYSRQLSFYQMIHYQVTIWWIETIIQCWEYEVEIQTLMRVICVTQLVIILK